MQAKHGVEPFAFAPPSFVLPEQAEALKARMAEEAATAARPPPPAGSLPPAGSARPPSPPAEAEEPVWILKPVAACRGQGISLHRSADGLPPEAATRRAVACRYVHPPYLIDGRKSDLRLYVLVTSWRPLVAYLHTEGLARLAAEPYARAPASCAGGRGPCTPHHARATTRTSHAHGLRIACAGMRSPTSPTSIATSPTIRSTSTRRRRPNRPRAASRRAPRRTAAAASSALALVPVPAAEAAPLRGSARRRRSTPSAHGW